MICNLLKYIFKNKHLAYIILLLFAVNSSLYSQNLRTLSTKNGLPQSFVSGLVQDNDGFIWIGTRNGLARYDGRDFKVYQNKYNDENSLASNIVIGIKKQDNENKQVIIVSLIIHDKDRKWFIADTENRITNPDIQHQKNQSTHQNSPEVIISYDVQKFNFGQVPQNRSFINISKLLMNMFKQGRRFYSVVFRLLFG